MLSIINRLILIFSARQKGSANFDKWFYSASHAETTRGDGEPSAGKLEFNFSLRFFQLLQFDSNLTVFCISRFLWVNQLRCVHEPFSISDDLPESSGNLTYNFTAHPTVILIKHLYLDVLVHLELVHGNKGVLEGRIQIILDHVALPGDFRWVRGLALRNRDSYEGV